MRLHIRIRPDVRLFRAQSVAAALVVVLLGFSTALTAPPVKASEEQAAAAEAKNMPVILLTGFEPFGPGRPPNPSWEGIKTLNGREWNGFRLVAKQLHCTWGTPLKSIEPWIEQYRPQAVFSFGQGGGGAFAFERRGRNRRGQIRDNDDALPPVVEIVADGPAEYTATADLASLVEKLAAKGHPMRISGNAGSYLCEETLYTIEHLKAVKKLDATVLFCHVPPLGSKLKEKPFTADDMQRFVLDLLDAWRASRVVSIDRAPTFFVSMNQAAAATVNTQEPEVKQFVEHYFRTWSNQDINGYGDCFLASASIQFLDPQGRLYTYGKTNFVEEQRAVHARAPQRIVEVPEKIEITFEAQLARAVVYWKLTAGPRVEFGYDHFTLVKQAGNWKIVNLVFYGVKPGN